MSFFRKIFRIPVFLLWFISVSVFCRILCSGKNAAERAQKWTMIWARVTAWIFNLNVRIEGNSGSFSGGLIASNHQSCLDILVLASTFKIRFAPKAEMRRWPVIGFLTQCNDPVWIDRSTPSKAKVSSAAMCQTMKEGRAMMVFPEGTTSDGKAGLLPFKSTSFQAVIDSGTAVLPVIIAYDEKCRELAQWVRQEAFLPYVWRVLGIRKTDVVLHILEPINPFAGEERKDLALRVYNIMNQKWRTL